LLAIALALVLGASQTAIANEASDRAALEAAAQAWVKAFNARDANALVALTTDDVVLMDPGLPPVSGREAARGALRNAVSGAHGQLTSVTKETVLVGDVAWRIAALAHKQRDRDAMNRGQSLEIWKRVKSEWKLHRHMSSGLLFQPKLLPPAPGPVLDKPTN
jgi:ketosteroid isomerase-like protein